MRTKFDDGTFKYACEWCKRNFSTDPAPHLSLVIGERTGVASLQGELPGWRLTRLLVPGRRHFCLDRGTPSCFELWLSAVLGNEDGPAPYPEYAQ